MKFSAPATAMFYPYKLFNFASGGYSYALQASLHSYCAKQGGGNDETNDHL